MLAVAALLCGSAAHGEVTVSVDPAKPGPEIDPRLYGIFLEEINTAIDGGLYAEMIRNRGFEESKPPEGFRLIDGKWVNAGGYATSFAFDADKSLPYWSVVQQGGATAELSLDLSGNLTPATPRAAKLQISSLPAGGRVALANEGFWGVSVKQGERYDLSLWVRGDSSYQGGLSVSVEGTDGTAASDLIRIEAPIGEQWRQVKVSFEAVKSVSRGKLVITANSTGTLWFDMVSMFPAKTFKERPNGMRQDIAQMIADLKPGFVRFPGGCVVEGATIETAYNWKKTIGRLEDREEAWNVWDYRRTHGMGYLEYLQFIKDINSEPMFVASAGQMCIFRNHTHPVPMDQMQPLAQNYIDALEYANGDASTAWGKRRIEDGHAEPFDMKMLEIGNENVGPEYEERYAFIYPQVKARYPEALVLACFTQPGTTEMVDEHYYNSPNWFINNESMYDSRDRSSPPVYIAEVAVTTNEGGRDRGNLRAALAEGVYLMGVERNSDVVKMVSYAPLLANVDGRTPLAGSPPAWHGMIYFDGERCFGTVSYHLWKLFGENRPNRSVSTVVASSDANAPVAGRIGVGTWGTSAEFKEVRVEKDGASLYGDTFPATADQWQTTSGRWQVAEGVYRQSREAISFSTFGESTWSDYTLTLKARKLSGNEGFLIMVGTSEEDRLWWNLGGWGNQEHGIELNQTAVGERVRGTIESGRWYDVKIELKGRSIKCYLDGKLIHDAVIPSKRPLHAIAGIDDKTGDLVLKVINTSKTGVPARLDLAGTSYATSIPKVTRLTSGRPEDNNSLDEPTKVAPTNLTLVPLAEQPELEFPASSLTVIRLGK
jgi:alpha-L-arabinofuranosidase